MGSNGINCFRYFWGKPFINWLFPPPRLVIKTVNHLKECRGEGLLLCPEWKTANYYPVLKSLNNMNAKYSLSFAFYLILFICVILSDCINVQNVFRIQ